MTDTAMTPTHQHLELAEQLARIESKLDALVEWTKNVQPLLDAGQEMAERMGDGGPFGLLSGILGG